MPQEMARRISYLTDEIKRHTTRNEELEKVVLNFSKRIEQLEKELAQEKAKRDRDSDTSRSSHE